MNERLSHKHGHDLCPRCHAARLRAWAELSDDEREVVRRLPASADASATERAARNLWCPRCWHEDPGAVPSLA